jgi:hypothetical protein
MTLAGALAALALILLATVGMVWLAVKILRILHRLCPEPPPAVAETNCPNALVYYHASGQVSGWPVAGAPTCWTLSRSSTLEGWEPLLGWRGSEDDVRALLRRLVAMELESGNEGNAFWKAVAQP